MNQGRCVSWECTQKSWEYEIAIDYYQKASEITLELGNKRTQGINLGNLGDFFF